MFNIAVIYNPWFSLGVHFDHQSGILAIHLPMLCIWIGRWDIIGATDEELLWSLRPTRTVEVLETRYTLGTSYDA